MMDARRFNELDLGDAKLTSEEMAEGYHFCCEWDGMLINKAWPEGDCCTCYDKKDDSLQRNAI